MKKTLIKGIAATAAAATAVLGFSNAASAFGFGTNGINFKEDTWVEFTFKQNRGWFDSTLAVYEVIDGKADKDTEFFLTGEELENSKWVKFAANKIYTLGLTNYNPNTGDQIGRTIYSTTSLNWAYRNGGVGYQQALFGYQAETEGEAFANPGDYTGGAHPHDGTVRISFEDTGTAFAGSDRDYNDFVVWAAPEPISMGGMALGAAGLAMARRRRAKKSA